LHHGLASVAPVDSGAPAWVSCSTSAARATNGREDRLAFSETETLRALQTARPDMRAAEASSGSTRSPCNSIAPAEVCSNQTGSRRPLPSLTCWRQDLLCATDTCRLSSLVLPLGFSSPALLSSCLSKTLCRETSHSSRQEQIRDMRMAARHRHVDHGR